MTSAKYTFHSDKNGNKLYASKYRGELSNLDHARSIFNWLIEKFKEMPQNSFIESDEGEFEVHIWYDNFNNYILNFEYKSHGYSLDNIIKFFTVKFLEIEEFFRGKGNQYVQASDNFLHLIRVFCRDIVEFQPPAFMDPSNQFKELKKSHEKLESSNINSFYIDGLENNDLFATHYNIYGGGYNGKTEVSLIYDRNILYCAQIVIGIIDEKFYNNFCKDVLPIGQENVLHDYRKSIFFEWINHGEYKETRSSMKLEVYKGPFTLNNPCYFVIS